VGFNSGFKGLNGLSFIFVSLEKTVYRDTILQRDYDTAVINKLLNENTR